MNEVRSSFLNGQTIRRVSQPLHHHNLDSRNTVEELDRAETEPVTLEEARRDLISIIYLYKHICRRGFLLQNGE